MTADQIAVSPAMLALYINGAEAIHHVTTPSAEFSRDRRVKWMGFDLVADEALPDQEMRPGVDVPAFVIARLRQFGASLVAPNL